MPYGHADMAIRVYLCWDIKWETERGVFEARAQREYNLIVLAKKFHDEI